MTLRLEEMTWPEVERRLESGTTLVVVVAASIEQHGPGLPLNVDAIRAEELGVRIADELGCFVAPVIRPGMSDLHLSFPGTISLRPETFEAVVRDYCRSLDHHGFENIALLTTHGGNMETLEAAASAADDRLDASVFVAGTRDGFLRVRVAAMADHGVPSDAAKRHAGAAETSFVLEARPELVDDERLSTGALGDPDLSDVDRIEAVSENGVIGDQVRASRAAGRSLIDASVRYYADAITEAMSE